MGRGGNKSEWQLKVDNVYNEWKYNDLHKNIKTHFNKANGREDVSIRLREQVDENCPIITDLNTLHNNVEKEQTNVKQKLFVRDSRGKIQFLGSKIEVTEKDVDDEEVIGFSKNH